MNSAIVKFEPEVLSRFWSKVDRSGDCWEFRGTILTSGYGQVKVRQKKWRAHRFAWVATHGPIPDGLLVRHRCDNPPCVKPAHLELGTHADNMRDKMERGRQTPLAGERHPLARLTVEAIREIRAAPSRHGVCVELAEKYGVKVGTVRAYRKRNQTNWIGA